MNRITPSLTPVIHLNIRRHPSLPVPRGRETWEQAHDPAFHARNDNVDMALAPAEVRHAAAALELDPDLPLQVWHSDTRRNRRAALLFADVLRPRWEVEVRGVPALGEAPFLLSALVSRAAFEATDRPRPLVRDAYLAAVLADRADAVEGGRAGVTAQVRALQARLAALPPVNLLWLSHGLLLPFLYSTLIEGVLPESWCAADLQAIPAFGYAEGFSLRLTSVTALIGARA